MIKRSLTLAGILATAVAGCAMAQQTSGTTDITPTPLPQTFNVPTPGYVIEQWAASGNTPMMRAHGWDIWTAMSQPSGQMYTAVTGGAAVNLPVWDTWQTDNEIFNTKTTVTAKSGKRTLHAFHLAHQQIHHLSPNAEPDNAVAISFNKFDPTAAAFILTKQTAPHGGTTAYAINSQAGLADLNATWPDTTPVGTRAIKDFPLTAIETKPVFFGVLAGTLTAVPLWQGAEQATNHKNPTPDTWFSCVLVDSTNADTSIRAATAAEIAAATIPSNFNCDKSKLQYAPMSLFYPVQLDAADAKGFNDLQGTTTETGLTLSSGDYAVLTAMHVNTKEMNRWTWQTFYWQGNGQFDVGWPGSLGDVPGGLAAPWSSYAMCTAYDQVIAGQRVTCFNPFLETSPGIPDGINSNCVSCHGMASVGGTATSPTTGIYPPIYTDNNVFKIPVDFSDPLLFGGRTKTDFSWAVAGGGSGTVVPPGSNKK